MSCEVTLQWALRGQDKFRSGSPRRAGSAHRRSPVEVAGAGVEVGLEDGRDVAVFVKFAHAAGTLIDFLGMVGIVAEEYQLVGLDLEVEATLHPAIGLHALAQLVGGTSGQLCHGHGGNAVLDVDGDGLSQLHIGDALDGRYEVERNLTVLYTDVLGMEVASSRL